MSKSKAAKAITRGDVVFLEDGRLYVEGWDEWQEGDLTAAKLVLESHLPAQWLKPDRDLVLRLGQSIEDIDIPALHARLQEVEAGRTLEISPTIDIEVSDDDPPTPGL